MDDISVNPDLEKAFSLLSEEYKQTNENEMLDIITNSSYVTDTGIYSDAISGAGHRVIFTLSFEKYKQIRNSVEKYENKIRSDISKYYRVVDEFIGEVKLDFEDKEVIANWRQDSGVFVKHPVKKKTVLEVAQKRIWDEGLYRVFLSHISRVKNDVFRIKETLKYFGVTAFVAHEDIKPTEEWQIEIENALFTMDAFVALMTDGFNESEWTDQEVGIAYSRDVPLLAARLGVDPYGFIGRFQGFRCTWDSAALEVMKILINKAGVMNSYIAVVEGCSNWGEGNMLSQVLPFISENSLTDKDMTRLISAYNENTEVRGSFGFNGTKTRLYGEGLLCHLKRITGKKLYLDASRNIVHDE